MTLRDLICRWMGGVGLAFFTPTGLLDIAKHPTRIESTLSPL
jgi:hypothetical protein